MTLLRQTVLIFLALSGLAAADFHSDVVMKGKKMASPAQFLKNARRLDAHDQMSPEDQEKMGKCMMGDCAPKFEAASAGGAAMCDAVTCAKGDDNCAPILKMMEDSPEMPKGMIGCMCDAGCSMSEETMEGPTEMCTFWDCAQTNADACGPMLDSEQIAEMKSMLGCICSSQATKDFMGAMDPKDGPCKDFYTGKERRLDAHEEEDDDEDLDICKVATDAPDGACAKALAPGWRAIQAEALCTDLKEQAEKDMKAGDQKCIDDMLAANPAPAPAAEADADAGSQAALPGLAGLLLAGLGALSA